ncbi:MAG TPA: hypothetical protein VKS22_11850 [Candidatus Binataceae bacterium]|nr:hypothetical protein [Candidatus Binataceae bacterium]
MAKNFEPGDREELPMFQSGGFVKETGLAVVHEGEYIMPAPGSEATIEPAQMMTEAVVNYYFPVEVVVVGGLSEEDHAAVEARIWRSFGDALNRMT